QWKIKGEKWFCSNANAELILMTARFDHNKSGTKGLGLFLLPSHLPNGEKNNYTLRRLKNKIGTRSMASSEIDFNGAHAWPVGNLEEGFTLVMENVLHISRIFNTFAVLGQSSRAYQIAKSYAHFREAFGKKIIEYPLVQETLAKVKSEQLALLAFIFKTTRLQDEADTNNEEKKLLLRTLVNLNKYISSLWTVEHIHRSIDILGGNGAIESFSPLPRLLRDSIVCENWEGTHNTLRMQILRDIHRYKVDELFISFLRNDLYHESFKESINDLEKDFQSLKGQSESIQTLLIKDIVHKMSMIVSALCLSQEAAHQTEKIKEKALSLFRKIHLGSPSYDNDYLKLIKEINGI
ncbi:MAG: acyl-CoA dehydrogenase family protein, partial [Bdellovibrionota bacterium]|nr:acyl-CoA dehydrogenase family protein [Bdellovibrionota bacterium]